MLDKDVKIEKHEQETAAEPLELGDLCKKESAAKKRPQDASRSGGDRQKKDSADAAEPRAAKLAPSGAREKKEPRRGSFFVRGRRRRFFGGRLIFLALIALAIAAAVILLGGLGKGGFGSRSSEAMALGALAPASASAASGGASAAGSTASYAAEQSAQQPLTITISGNDIFYMGEKLTPEELRQALQAHYTSGKVKLIDDRAIKAAYDSAVAVLDELGISHEQ